MTEWLLDRLMPTWLTRRWCRRRGHPQRRRFEIVVCCDDCDVEHPVATLVCCGFCYQAIGAVEHV